MKRQFWIGITASAIFLYFTFRKTDFGLLLERLEETRPLWLIPAILLTFLSILVRGYRWRFFFPARGMPSVSGASSATLIGFMANNIFPARMGEIVRAYVLARTDGRSVATVLATIAMERVFDLLSLLLLFGWVVLAGSLGGADQGWEPPEWLVMAGFGSAALSLGIIAVLLGVLFWRDRLERLIQSLCDRFIPRWSTRAQGLFRSGVEGLEILGSWRRIGWVLILSLVIWGILAISLLCIFQATGIQQGLFGALLLILVLAFGVAVPSGPGFVGTFHYFCKLALTSLGETPEAAAFYALISHAASVIPITLAGFVVLMLKGLSIRDIRQRRMEPAE